MKKYKVLIFDFGDVIISNPASKIFKSISKEFGVKYSLIEKVVSKFTPKVQTNQLPEKVFWKEMSERLGIKSETKLKEIWMRTYEENAKINKEMIALLKELKKRYKLCLVSNTTKFHKKVSFRKVLKSIFDVVIYSCDIGMRKPEKGIYLYLLEKIKEDPEKCIIVDDEAKNLKYPKKLGMEAILFKSVEQLKTKLKKMGIEFT